MTQFTSHRATDISRQLNLAYHTAKVYERPQHLPTLGQLAILSTNRRRWKDMGSEAVANSWLAGGSITDVKLSNLHVVRSHCISFLKGTR